MSRTSGWTRLRSSFVALGIVAGAATAAQADAITSTNTITPVNPTPIDPSQTVLGFDTTKSFIGNAGVTGDPSALKIVPVAGGSFLSPSNISLGAFQATPMSAGQSVSFNNTPFHFMFAASSINGQGGISPNQTPVDIGGVLNGTLTGANQSTVTATFGKSDGTGVFQPFQSTDALKFTTGLYTNTLKMPTGALAIVPSTTNGGVTTARRVLSNVSVASPVPEPSTAVLFAATVAGLGFRYRLRKARAQMKLV